MELLSTHQCAVYYDGMLTVREKHFLKKYVFGTVGIIVLLIFVGVLARGTWGVYQKAQFAKESRDQARLQLAELTQREASLQEEIDRMNSPRGIEEEVRQKFDVGRPGEKMVVFVDTPVVEEPHESERRTVWQRITEFFGR